MRPEANEGMNETFNERYTEFSYCIAEYNRNNTDTIKNNGFRSIWNNINNKSDKDEPIRMQSSLELLSYVADAQSPQPITKQTTEEGNR